MKKLKNGPFLDYQTAISAIVFTSGQLYVSLHKLKHYNFVNMSLSKQIKPGKQEKQRIVCTMKEKQYYARLTRDEKANFKTVAKEYKRIHHFDMHTSKIHRIQ